LSETKLDQRFELLDRLPKDASELDFADAVLEGLNSRSKTLPCRFFYDEAGSKLFEAICDLPEYYLTRSEREILTNHADKIVSGLPADLTLVELGSGSAVKTRLLIEALLKERDILRFTPIDISKSALEESSQDLLKHHPSLEILAVAGEYQDGIEALKEENSGPELILWLGSSIGNLTRSEARDFLHGIRDSMSDGDRLLVGIDLRKSASILEPAYDDAAGVTAAFNLNILNRINGELGGNFDLDAFRHLAVYDDVEGRVEMHLVSQTDQTVRIDALDREFSFVQDERIHTENSYKYALEEIDTLVEWTDLKLKGQWFDSEERFSLNLLQRGEDPLRSVDF
jgi:dimethylhistidine N-methyltransferase